MKNCSICKTNKPYCDFHKASQENDGYERRCKCCLLKRKSELYYANHEVNREKARIKSNSYKSKNEGYQRKWDLKRIYGITLEKYNNMLDSQNYSCKICKSKEPGGRHDVFNIDHCHATGTVRGLLCVGCNMALGGFKDSIESLSIAIEYLKNQGDI